MDGLSLILMLEADIVGGHSVHLVELIDEVRRA